MRDRQTCVGCGKKSPETETNYTLISAQFGWRLTRYKNPDGSLVVEWRCPACWREYKRTRNSSPETVGPPSSVGHGAPLVRTPLPRPPTPYDSFRTRPPPAPSSSGELPRIRSPIPASPPAASGPPTASRASRPPPRPSAPPRPTPAQPTPSTIPTDRPRRPGR